MRLKPLHAAAMTAALIAALGSAPAMAQSADWSRQVARIIASKQTYPATAQMRGDEGTAKVRLQVGSSGSIDKVELVSGTGSSTLDKEAVEAPRRAGSLPAPPGGPTAVIVPITWKLM